MWEAGVREPGCSVVVVVIVVSNDLGFLEWSSLTGQITIFESSSKYSFELILEGKEK